MLEMIGEWARDLPMAAAQIEESAVSRNQTNELLEQFWRIGRSIEIEVDDFAHFE